MEKLNFLAPIEANIPQELKELSQWAVWKGEVVKNGKDKITKIPYNAKTGGKAKVNDAATWSDFQTAWDRCQKDDFDGVTFALSENDSLVGWDLDNCRDPATEDIEEEPLKIINRLASYSEASPSGKGVRVFVKAGLPPGGRKKGKIEVYDKGRFLTVTGHVLPQASPVIEERIVKVKSLHKEIFGEKKETSVNQSLSNNNTVHSAETQAAASQDILRKAFDSKNGAKIQRLYNGDTSDHPSPSEADQALCNHLAYFSNGDFSAVDSLFRASGLYREKWDERHHSDGRTYGKATIENALGSVKSSYSTKETGNKKDSKSFKPRIVSAYELGQMDFPEPKWAVPGIVVEGLNLLAAKPKEGKSILALNLCLAVAGGGKALGEIDVEQGGVLYVSLEDNFKLIQERLFDMSGTTELPKNFYLIEEWPRMDESGLEFLEEEIKRAQNLRLVVIDTLAAFKPAQVKRNASLYDIDYDNISKIKKLADKYEVSILVIHHVRKLASDDIMETLSGTFGLTGAADNLLVLKRENNQIDATLHAKGRRIENREIALKFNLDVLSWEYLGNPEDIKSTPKMQKLYDALKESQEPLSPKKLVKITGLRLGYIDKTLKKFLDKGDAKKVEWGKYIFNRSKGENNDKGKIGQNEQNDENAVDTSQSDSLKVESGKVQKIMNSNDLKDNPPIPPNLPPYIQGEYNSSNVCQVCKSDKLWKKDGAEKWTCGECHPPGSKLKVEWKRDL